jgi:hypothetical protein
MSEIRCHAETGPRPKHEEHEAHKEEEHKEKPESFVTFVLEAVGPCSVTAICIVTTHVVD